MAGTGGRAGSESKDESISVTIGNDHRHSSREQDDKHSRDYDRHRDGYEDRHHYEHERNDRYHRGSDRDRDKHDRERDSDRYDKERSTRSNIEGQRQRTSTSSISLEDDYRMGRRGYLPQPYTSLGPRSAISLEEDKRMAMKERDDKDRERASSSTEERQRKLAHGTQKDDLEKTGKEKEHVLPITNPKYMPLYPEGELSQQQFGKWGDEAETNKAKLPPANMFKTGNWKPITTFPTGAGTPDDKAQTKPLGRPSPNASIEGQSRALRSILKSKRAAAEEMSKLEQVSDVSSAKAPLFPVSSTEQEKRDIDRRDIKRRDIDRRNLERKDIDRREPERRDSDRRDPERRDTDRRNMDRHDIDRRDVGRHEPDRREPDRNIIGKECERLTLGRGHNIPKLVTVPSSIGNMDIDDEDAFLYGDGGDNSQPRLTKKLTIPSPVSSISGSLASGQYQSPRLERERERDRYLRERSPSPDHKRRRNASPEPYYRNQSPDRLGPHHENRLSPARRSPPQRSPLARMRSPPHTSLSSHTMSRPPHKPSRSPSVSSDRPGSYIGRAPSPPLGRAPSPPLGRAPSPPLGRAPSPPLGRAPSPPLGRSPSPPLGRAPSPPLGRSPSPPLGRSPPPNVSREQQYYQDRRDRYNRAQLEAAEIAQRHPVQQTSQDLDSRKDVNIHQDTDSRNRGPGTQIKDTDSRGHKDLDLRNNAARIQATVLRLKDTDARMQKPDLMRNQDTDSRIRDVDPQVPHFQVASGASHMPTETVHSRSYEAIPPSVVKTSRELPPWEKKRLEREANSSKEHVENNPPPAPEVVQPELAEKKGGKKESHDPTIENILKSIGFNFELSKLMQEKANKERQKPNETEEFGIKESSSFMSTGIVSQDEAKEKKKSPVEAQESYAERAKRYIQEHALAKAMGRASPLPFVESEKQREEERSRQKQKLPEGIRDENIERLPGDLQYVRDRRSRSSDRYHKSHAQSHDRTLESGRYRRERGRHDRYRSRSQSRSLSRSLSRSRSRSRSRAQLHSRSRSRSRSRYDSMSRSRSYSRSRSHSPDRRRGEKIVSPSHRSFTPQPQRDGTQYPPFEQHTFSNVQDRSSGARPDRYGQYPPYGKYNPSPSDAYGESALGVPPTVDVPPTLGMHPASQNTNLRVLTRTGDQVASPTNSKRTVLPPKSEQARLVKEQLLKVASEVTERRKVMIKGPVIKDVKSVKKGVGQMKALSASERSNLLAQSAERTRRLAVLEKELDRLRKQQNELMRKRQRQKDGHKDPLLIENSKLQEEIATQISALRKAVEENASALYDIPETSFANVKEVKTTTKDQDSRQLEREQVKEEIKDEVEAEVVYEYFDPGNHWCRPCNYISSNVYKLFEHITSRKHLAKLSPYERPWMPDVPVKKEPKGQVCAAPLTGTEFLYPTQAFFCTLCKEFAGDSLCAEEHLKSSSHNKNYKKYCVDNPFYERRMTLDKAAGLSSSAFKMQPAKEEEESKKVPSKSATSKPAQPSSPLSRSKEKAGQGKDYRNQKAQENNKNVIAKEKLASKNVIELDTDTPAPTHKPIVARRYGMAKNPQPEPKQELDSVAAALAIAASKAAAEKESSQRKGISIKLTGKTSLANKPASNPLVGLTRTIPKPVAAPQRASAFLAQQQQQKRTSMNRSQLPPPSLDNFLSIDKGGALPMFTTPPDVTDPSVLQHMTPQDRERFAEMKMLGILPEGSPSSQPVPRPPPLPPTAPSKAGGAMAATGAAKMYDVFYSNKDNSSGTNNSPNGEKDDADDEVEMDMGDFDILDECGDG